TDDEAAVFADTICEADLRGYGSHGLLRVPDAIHLVRQGVLQVSARPRLAAERPAAVLLDGDRALGPCGAVAATREAMARAWRGRRASGSPRGWRWTRRADRRRTRRRGWRGRCRRSAAPKGTGWGSWSRSWAGC